jgi:hypothetical protein
MQYDEITQRVRGEELVFARTSRRNWYLGEDDIGDRPPTQAVTFVQQYKFIRLQKRFNYEPLIMCLKGLQMSYNPGDYLTVEQLRSDEKLRDDYMSLKEWAERPSQISEKTIGDFMEAVNQGLMTEYHKRPAHKLYYINWALGSIETQLKNFNNRLKEQKQ